MARRYDPFNIQAYGANVYAAYSPSTMQWMTAGLRFDWDFTLLGNQSFLDRYRLTPQLSVREADWTDTTLFYQLEIRVYRTGLPDRRLDRDGDTHAFGVNQSFELCKMFERPLMANLSYRFENVSTDGTEFASKNNIFAFGLDVPLPLELTFDFRSEWEVGHYKNRSLFDFASSHRRDVIHNLIFGLTKRFDEHLSVRFQVDVTDADSNISDNTRQEPFSYNRVIYGLTLVYRF